MAKDKFIKESEEAQKEWEEKILKSFLEKNPERMAAFTTLSGEPIKKLYTPVDLVDFDYLRDLGFPGQYPYTRGIHPTMYRGRLWTMRIFSGFGSARDTNRRYRYLLDQGLSGLSVAFHLPTLMGYDSDHPKSLGEVGKCGVAVDSLADMEVLFDSVDLSKITTSMTINSTAMIALAMYIALAEKQGVASDQIGGTIQNDILKEYIAQKTWIFPPKPSMRIITDIFGFCSRQVPKWNTISISGYHIREAGATAAQELAFTLADGFAYVEAGLDAGLNVDDFAPRLSFFFDCHNDFFEEIAKFRAARRIWARELMSRFGARDQRSLLLRFHTHTAGVSLTRQQPENNVVRVAIQALAAVLGGTQSLHTVSRDEVLALPTEEAATIALRTQQIIAHESGVADMVDPFGGSYFVEALTNKLEEEAYDYFKKIDALGGMVAAVEKGFPQREIIEASHRYQMEVDRNEKIIVGVNEFVADEEAPLEILKINEAVELEQRERLAELRKKRDGAKVARALDELKKAAQSGENLMPCLVEAARVYATVGEISDALREVFGEYRDPAIF